MADNFRFDIAGAPLESALLIAWLPRRDAVGWMDEENKKLLLFWTMAPGVISLPSPMGLLATIQMVDNWLNTADYGPEPDIGGYCTKGCRVYNEEWGHVAGKWQAFVAIEPYWNLHGK